MLKAVTYPAPFDADLTKGESLPIALAIFETGGFDVCIEFQNGKQVIFRNLTGCDIALVGDGLPFTTAPPLHALSPKRILSSGTTATKIAVYY